jgi:hypothetical protein
MNTKANDLHDVVHELAECFGLQMASLRWALDHANGGRLENIRIVARSSCSTGNAIRELGKEPECYFAEMTMLARSFIEKIINFCYLFVCDEDDYQNFLLHPYYRMFHNFDRQKSAGEKKFFLRFSGKDALRSHPTIDEALARFSENNPRQNWSKKSVDQKVAVLSGKSTIQVGFFLMNTATIYSNASEALHGSLYGCTFHLGRYEPSIDCTDIAAVQKQVWLGSALLFAQLGSMTSETVKLIASLHPMPEAVVGVEGIDKNAEKLLARAFGKSC